MPPEPTSTGYAPVPTAYGTGRLGPVPADSTDSQLLATAGQCLSLRQGHGQDSSATWQPVLIGEPVASSGEAQLKTNRMNI